MSIFVVGMNGSGTSMLAESLGRHRELYSFPGEARMIPHLIDRVSRFGDLENDANFRRLWQYVITSAPDFEVFNDHQPLVIPDNWQEFPRCLATIIDAVFRQFALEQGKQRWCEKSPNNSEHLLKIAALFPSAKFVHIIRDGRDCAASINRRQYRNAQLSIYRWRLIVTEARRQGSQIPNRYLEVKYEDLTEEPEKWMQVLCDFLNMSFDDRVLQSSMPQSAKRDSLPNGSIGKIESNSKKFLKYFNACQIESLERISGKMLQELGYDTMYFAGAEDLGWIKSRFIRAVDFVKANHWLWKKLAGEPGMTWRKVVRGTLASIREYSSKKY